MSEVVRKQLTSTIRRKEGQIRSLNRQEEQYRRDAAALARKREAVQAEVNDLTAHLTELGGPVESEKKLKTK